MQPQQNYPQSPMQPAPSKRKRALGEYVTWAMIIVGVLLVLSLIAWLVITLMGKTSSDTGKTQAGVAAVLEPSASAPAPRTIKSQLGVQVPYDTRELEGYGFAEDVTFSTTDLDQARPYSVIRIRPVETSEATRSEVTLESPELRLTSSTNAAYWDSLSSKKEYEDLSKIDMLVKETVTAHEKDASVESSDAEVANINDVDYRKVTFTYTNERYGVKTERREDCYMAVQHDRPYVACINNIRASNFSVVPQLESVLEKVSYDGLEEEALVTSEKDDEKDAAMLDNKDDEEVEATTSGQEDVVTEDEQVDKVPAYLEESNSFRAMAVATPSVVRVGTVYCADIKLTLPNGGSGPTLTGACLDKAGSGFFVSRDGLVATSGSTTQVKPQEAIAAYITNAPDSGEVTARLQRVLDYLVEARVLMQTDADALIAGVDERDQDIIDKVNAISTRIEPEDIAITEESYSYAVQLADKPIVVNENGDGSASFAYTDTVVKAEVEGQKYTSDISQEAIFKGESVESDTTLLKVDKSATYPTLKLSLAGEGVGEGSPIALVGMPMYAFGSLASAQFRDTPIYRLGAIDQTFNADGGQKIRSISTTSHAGLAGAPALDGAGDVAGVATYNNLNCPDRKCFASTVVRDTSGIEALIKERNITLQSASLSSDTWKQAIDELLRGNYKKATQLFESAHSLYPQNYLAPKFAAYSKSQYGSASDTSTMNIIVSVLKTVAVIAVGILILLTILKVALKLFIRPHTETQYGAMSGGQYIDPNQWQHQQTQPPQTLAPLSQVPQQPQQWQPPVMQQPANPQSAAYGQEAGAQNSGQSPQQSAYPPTQPPQQQ